MFFYILNYNSYLNLKMVFVQDICDLNLFLEILFNFFYSGDQVSKFRIKFLSDLELYYY